MSDSFDSDNYEDLDSFGDEYKPEHAFDPGLDSLADGDYQFEIVSATLGKASSGDRIMEMVIRPNGGIRIKHTYWLSKQIEMNKLGADLGVLGFPSHKWGKEIPISKAMPEAVAKLAGIRFLGAKRTSTGKKDGKVFHNLYINARVSSDSQPATSPGFNSKPAAEPADKLPF